MLMADCRKKSAPSQSQSSLGGCSRALIEIRAQFVQVSGGKRGNLQQPKELCINSSLLIIFYFF
jgi:hypothetical protein